jgi:ElaB/YqjD/DUF883 family membrane-anchored ribosome-binding protein
MSATSLNTERLTSSLKRVATESEALLKATAGVIGDKAEEVRERLSDALETAKRNCRELEAKTIEGARATDKVIRDHPYQSIGVAFGLGLLIGVLVTRR